MDVVWVLVGSESGTALDYGERAAEELIRGGLHVRLALLDDFAFETLLEARYFVFICSTTGDGEAPANMRRFLQTLLRSDLPHEMLTDAKVSVFGLGDSSYDKFNFVSKRLWRRLGQLQAQFLVPGRGEGDEREEPDGLEAGWRRWWPEVKMMLLTLLGSAAEARVFGPWDPLPPRLAPQFELKDALCQKDLQVSALSDAMECTVIGNERFTPPDHFQDTRLLKLQISKDVQWSPGDVIRLAPWNDKTAVSGFITMMGWNEGLTLCFMNNADDPTWADLPMHVTLRTLLAQFCDLNQVPSRTAMRRLATLADAQAAPHSPLHVEKLQELAEDEAAYLDYVWRPKRTVVEVLCDFQPTLRLPPERIFDLFGRIRPRLFSIANIPSAVPGQLEVLAALVNIDCANREARPGLFSRWIQSGCIADELHTCAIIRGSLRPSLILTPQTTDSLFLFAAGTGIAPCRALIQACARMNNPPLVYLYFGCRSLKADYYFETEWPRYASFLQVFAKGSRDTPSRKVYLDSIVADNSAPLIQAIRNGPDRMTILVAGHSRLPALVTRALKDSVINADVGIDADALVQELKSSGRFQTETWS